MKTKQRLDLLLVERELVESRTKAQALIMAGEVLVNGQVETKASATFKLDVGLSIKEGQRFVSRGGEKMEGAFKNFDLNVKDMVCVDIGASTGGFTDCLLQHGARLVYSVDVGKGQLHWKLRNDPRVVIIDECNARNLDEKLFPQKPSFATVDVSFISLMKILPALVRVMNVPFEMLTLIKPQFEAGPENVEKGGVVRDENIRRKVVEDIRAYGENTLMLKCAGICESPLKGPAGNTEYLAYWKS